MTIIEKLLIRPNKLKDFLTDKECEHFINISRDNLNSALVSGDKEGYVSNGRTGKNYWLNHNTDNITSAMIRNAITF